VKYDGLDAPEAGTIYTPLSIWPESGRTLFVRTPGDPLAVLPAVRNVIRQMDPSLPLSQVATMRDILDESLAQPRNLLLLVGGFAAIALLLAAIGIYGVMAYFVQHRSQDMAIRIAMGGSPAQVLGLVVRQGMLLVGGGVAIGVAGALALTRYMSSVLFEVEVTDPVTFASVAFGVVLVALSACLLPARRAARVNPAAMLREE
ncbi:MAG: FtsX-like permease family protein, partial [Acidobacteriota bacterium]